MNKKMDFLTRHHPPGRTLFIDSNPGFEDLHQRLTPKISRHGYVVGDPSWRFSLPSQSYHRLIWMISGRARAEWEGRSLTLQRGQVCFFPSGLSYDFSADRSFEHFFLHFTLEIAPGVDLFRGKKNPESRKAPVDLTKIRWKNDFFGGRVGGWMECAARLQSLIGSFTNLDGADLAEAVRLSGKYATLFEAVRREPFEKQRLSYLAAQARMPVRTLRHAFQKDLGIGLPEYVRRQFVERAQDLLLGSTGKIKEISAQLGFRDEYHFSRVFHRVTGLSPSRYRSLHQEKSNL